MLWQAVISLPNMPLSAPLLWNCLEGTRQPPRITLANVSPQMSSHTSPTTAKQTTSWLLLLPSMSTTSLRSLQPLRQPEIGETPNLKRTLWQRLTKSRPITAPNKLKSNSSTIQNSLSWSKSVLMPTLQAWKSPKRISTKKKLNTWRISLPGHKRLRMFRLQSSRRTLITSISPTP